MYIVCLFRQQKNGGYGVDQWQIDSFDKLDLVPHLRKALEKEPNLSFDPEQFINDSNGHLWNHWFLCQTVAFYERFNLLNLDESSTTLTAAQTLHVNLRQFCKNQKQLNGYDGTLTHLLDLEKVRRVVLSMFSLDFE